MYTWTDEIYAAERVINYQTAPQNFRDSLSRAVPVARARLSLVLPRAKLIAAAHFR